MSFKFFILYIYKHLFKSSQSDDLQNLNIFPLNIKPSRDKNQLQQTSKVPLDISGNFFRYFIIRF